MASFHVAYHDTGWVVVTTENKITSVVAKIVQRINKRTSEYANSKTNPGLFYQTIQKVWKLKTKSFRPQINNGKML